MPENIETIELIESYDNGLTSKHVVDIDSVKLDKLVKDLFSMSKEFIN